MAGGFRLSRFRADGRCGTILAADDLLFEGGRRIHIRGGLGSGKTLLSQALTGFGVEGSELSVRCEVEWLTGSRRDARVAYVPQDIRDFFIGSSVEDELRLARAFSAGRLVISKEAVVARYLDAFLGKAVDKLSGGQRRFLAIYCAVLSCPDVLIVDGGYSSLDAHARGLLEMVLNEWVKIRDGVLIVTGYGQPAPSGGPWTCYEVFERQLVLVAEPTPNSPSESPPVPPQDQAPLLTVRGMACGYGKPVPVVRSIDLDIDEGEIIGVRGPNGAGKSTIFRHLTGYFPILAGKVNWSRLSRGLVGIVPQCADALLRGRKVIDEVDHRDEGVLATYRSLLKAFGLELDEVDSYLLSAGERCLVACAVALAQRPDLLVLDEVDQAVPPEFIERVVRVARLVNPRLSSVVISHDDALLARVSTRIIRVGEAARPRE